MPKCFVCGDDRSFKRTSRVLDKNVCSSCKPYLGGSGITPEREVACIDHFDRQTKGTPNNIR